MTYWISARTRPPVFQWNQWRARTAAEALEAAEEMLRRDMKKLHIAAPDGAWLDLDGLRARAAAERRAAASLSTEEPG